MSISIINTQVKVFMYVPPREKCVRPTLCPFRVRTHQVLLRTHVCVVIGVSEGFRLYGSNKLVISRSVRLFMTDESLSGVFRNVLFVP